MVATLVSLSTYFRSFHNTYELLHPNLKTEVYCVLGLQEESKTMHQGMQTVCVKYCPNHQQHLYSDSQLIAPLLLTAIQRCARWVQWPSITITSMTTTSSVRR